MQVEGCKLLSHQMQFGAMMRSLMQIGMRKRHQVGYVITRYLSK